jgi:hypothetical protein
MSLAIDIESVEAVLLLGGQWHKIEERSFTIDSYEFFQEGQLLIEGGQVQGLQAIGASWSGTKKGERYACPLTAILAVKYKETKAMRKPGTAK